MVKEVYRIKRLDTGEVREWVLPEILEEIERCRTDGSVPFDGEDWREGWDAWCEGRRYALLEDTAVGKGTFIAVSKFASFQLDYDARFVRKAFAAKPPYFIDHLESKFHGCHDRFGSMAAMLMFWAELSEDNRAVLIDYILNRPECR